MAFDSASLDFMVGAAIPLALMTLLRFSELRAAVMNILCGIVVAAIADHKFARALAAEIVSLARHYSLADHLMVLVGAGLGGAFVLVLTAIWER